VNRRIIFLAILLGGILVPHAASANAGTPLMLATAAHLFFGNALIGIGEGLLLAKLFKLPPKRCVGWMIVANYFSSWFGLIALKDIAAKLDWNLYNAWSQFWLAVVVAYLLTIVLEWPVIAVCFRKTERWVGRSIKATLLLQSVSYLVLFGWYWGASVKTLYTQMNIVPASELSLPANLKLFYISSNGQICQGTQVVSKRTSVDRNDRLLFVANPEQANTWSLQLRPEAVVVIPTIHGTSATDEAKFNGTPDRDTWMTFGKAVQLIATTTNKWEFYSGFWAGSGLRGKNSETGERLQVGWEMPFGNWIVRNAIQLPDERVIFQLGYDQICLLDPDTRRIALLVRGRGPAVLKE
jgi:hypothetical protein